MVSPGIQRERQGISQFCPEAEHLLAITGKLPLSASSPGPARLWCRVLSSDSGWCWATRWPIAWVFPELHNVVKSLSLS